MAPQKPAALRSLADDLFDPADDLGAKLADDRMTSSDGNWRARIWQPGDEEPEYEEGLDPSSFAFKGLRIMDHTADYDEWLEEQRTKNSMPEVKALWPTKARLDDVMTYIAIQMFTVGERSKRFPAGFDSNGNIRSQRPHWGGGCRVYARSGAQYFVVFKGYYCLAGEDVPRREYQDMGLGTISKGRKASASVPNLSFGQVALTRSSAEKIGFIIFR
ncbi:hypothetical protein B0A52_06208 [Exophiala mesophila]|uniref:Uncharacterized protein n=1 Tax=Exophiala mesophila TaxID=212818 RepID=A0A438N2S7_EXOME|nr:hypothetical protein B0A52_06208 [Exophiala mesophila]